MEVFGKKGKISNRDYNGSESDGHKNMINEFLERNNSGEHMDLDLVEDTMTLLNALYQSHQTKTSVSGKFAQTSKRLISWKYQEHLINDKKNFDYWLKRQCGKRNNKHFKIL